MRVARTSAIAAGVLAASVACAQTQYGKPAAPPSIPNVGMVNACPWLTEGSAARMLGGDVSVSSTATNKQEGSCRFARRSEPRVTLEISVSRQPRQDCSGQGLQLKGIGNEAVRCTLPAPHSEAAQMISSRVRDMFFTVVCHMPAQKSAEKSAEHKADPEDDGLEHVAEQVAGNLY